MTWSITSDSDEQICRLVQESKSKFAKIFMCTWLRGRHTQWNEVIFGYYSTYESGQTAIIKLYWSSKILFIVPVLRLVIKRNRFQQILKFLHFHDNIGLPDQNDENYDRLIKSAQSLTICMKNFWTHRSHAKMCVLMKVTVMERQALVQTVQ